MQELSEPVRELTPFELALVAGGVALAAGGNNSASVIFSGTVGAVVLSFYPNGMLSTLAILGPGGWIATAT
jgi:broad specificity polyphosphatase/5'/3'-nucleotidase SurE